MRVPSRHVFGFGLDRCAQNGGRNLQEHGSDELRVQMRHHRQSHRPGQLGGTGQVGVGRRAWSAGQLGGTRQVVVGRRAWSAGCGRGWLVRCVGRRDSSGACREDGLECRVWKGLAS